MLLSFFKVTFGAEFHVAGGVDRIRKFDGPVRVLIDNRATPDRTAQVETAIADIRSRIKNLDIARTDRRDDANMMVSLVNDRRGRPEPGRPLLAQHVQIRQRGGHHTRGRDLQFIEEGIVGQEAQAERRRTR